MGAFLDKPITEKDIIKVPDANGMRACAAAMQGWRVEMEDAHIINTSIAGNDKTGIFGVYDGHGGQFVSRYASQHLLEVIQREPEYEEGKKDINKLGEAIKKAYLDIDEDLKKQEVIINGEDHSGCTAVTCIVTPKSILCANAGDSRSVLYSGDEVVEMSHDHKPYNDGERLRIIDAGGVVAMRRVNGDLAVSRALGDFSYKQKHDLPAEKQQVTCYPDTYVHERRDTDKFLILACDGIWDVMSNEEICRYISDELECEEKIEDVVTNVLDHCLEKGSRDNMSVILVLFDAAPKPIPERVQKRKEEKEQKAKELEEQRNKEAAGNTQ